MFQCYIAVMAAFQVYTLLLGVCIQQNVTLPFTSVIAPSSNTDMGKVQQQKDSHNYVNVTRSYL